MNVLNFGSLNIDHTYQLDHFPTPGETVSAKAYSIFCGGKGLNQSIALKNSGISVFHAGQIGEDGKDLVRFLQEKGVDTRYISQKTGPTGHALIQVDHNGQNCITIYKGANEQIDSSWAKQVLRQFESGDFLLLQNEINNLETIIREAHDRGMIIFLNPAPFTPEFHSLPLNLIDYLIVNEIEAAELSGTNNIQEMIRFFHSSYSDKHVIITLGKYGSYYLHKETTLYTGIYEVPVCDTTTAGDTFIGFFVGETVKGNTPDQALKIAAKASAITVSRIGASISIPTIDEVVKTVLPYREVQHES